MEENKVFISQNMISYIKRKRRELSLTAYELSSKCGRGKYWINNIENGRTRTITESDAIRIYKELDDTAYGAQLDDFLKRVESGEISESDIFETRDFNDDCRSEEGGDYFVFDAEAHKKVLKKQLNVAHRKMLNLLDKIDYNDVNSIRSYEAYIKVYNSLFTSLGGQECFKKIFKYPVQLVPNSELEKIVEIITTSTSRHYDIAYDIDGKPYLSLVKDDDSSDDFS